MGKIIFNYQLIDESNKITDPNLCAWRNLDVFIYKNMYFVFNYYFCNNK